MTQTTTLPVATADIDQAYDDLRDHGVAIVLDVFPADVVAHARRRLLQIAEDERRAGVAIRDDGTSASGALRPGANQRILSLLEKDVIFGTVAATPELSGLAGRLFADSYGYPADVVARLELDAVLLSSVTANIACRGGQPMSLHWDQGFAPPAAGVPVLLNVVLPLVEFTSANGATRVAPGSHLADPRVLMAEPPPAMAVEAPAGAAIVIDGRTWHGTGANTTDAPRPAVLVNYCPPWVRAFEDRGRTVGGPVSSSLPDDRRLLDLLGHRPWFVFGRNQASAPS